MMISYSIVISKPECRLVINLIILEFNLIFRNKQTKLFGAVSVFFALLSLFPIINSTIKEQSDFFQIFMVYFSLGAVFTINFTRIIFNWDSQFFDKILTTPIGFEYYVISKFVVIQIVNFLFLTVDLIIISNLRIQILSLIIGLFVYIIGFLNISHILLANYTITPVNINGGLFTSGAEKIFPVPYFFSIAFYGYPLFVYYIYSEIRIVPMDNLSIILWLGFPGVLSLILSPIWLRKITKTLEKKKYRMATIFRGLN